MAVALPASPLASRLFSRLGLKRTPTTFDLDLSLDSRASQINLQPSWTLALPKNTTQIPDVRTDTGALPRVGPSKLFLSYSCLQDQQDRMLIGLLRF